MAGGSSSKQCLVPNTSSYSSNSGGVGQLVLWVVPVKHVGPHHTPTCHTIIQYNHPGSLQPLLTHSSMSLLCCLVVQPLWFSFHTHQPTLTNPLQTTCTCCMLLLLPPQYLAHTPGASMSLLNEVKGNTHHYLAVIAEAADSQLATLSTSGVVQADVYDNLQENVSAFEVHGGVRWRAGHGAFAYFKRGSEVLAAAGVTGEGGI